MEKPFKVWKDVYIIGSAELSHPYDCCVYLLDADDLVLVDSGAGRSFDKLVSNIESLGFNPGKLKTIIVTHAHIDHIGSLHRFREVFGTQVIAHELDSRAIETGEGVGAETYGVNYIPCTVDLKIQGSEESFQFGAKELKIVHIPGHTPGSIATYIDIDDKRILFGQDIHGPYYRQWGGDPLKAKQSLRKLKELKSDILCEGHFGIYQPASAVEEYIQGYIDSL